MGKVKFTEEQMTLLRENKYTVKVTESSISLSQEFKEIFYKEYLMGTVPRDILRKYGYPPEVLGNRRVWGITGYIKKEYEKYGFFRDCRTKYPSDITFNQSADAKIRSLEHQVNYLTQEVEFLKKISLIKTQKK